MRSLLLISLVAQAAEGQESAAGGLTTFSWSFMLLSMGAVSFLMAWCYSRILRTKKHFDPDGTGPAAPPVGGDVTQEEVS